MNQTITITSNPDGTYTVTSAGDDDAEDSAQATAATAGSSGAPADDSGTDSDQPLNQTCKSVDEVLQLVQQELSEEQGEGDAWNQEAASRDATGQRVPPGGAQPTMSM